MHGNPRTFKLGDPRKPEMNLGIDPERCAGNHVVIEGQAFRLWRRPMRPMVSWGRLIAKGSCTPPMPQPGPRRCASLDPPRKPCQWSAGSSICVKAWIRFTGQFRGHQPMLPSIPCRLQIQKQLFIKELLTLQTVERVRVDTPDPALMPPSPPCATRSTPVALRDPYIFRHGCMAFSIPFLGWRVIVGRRRWAGTSASRTMRPITRLCR